MMHTLQWMQLVYSLLQYNNKQFYIVSSSTLSNSDINSS